MLSWRVTERWRFDVFVLGNFVVLSKPHSSVLNPCRPPGKWCDPTLAHSLVLTGVPETFSCLRRTVSGCALCEQASRETVKSSEDLLACAQPPADPSLRRPGRYRRGGTMIQSFFLLNNTGEVLIEKHWRGVTSRAVCDYFWDEVNKYESKEEMPPVISTSKYYLISIYRGDVFLLVTSTGETNPLSAMEFLHRVYDIFEEYFGNVEEATIKENFATVYQLLEEMMDFGYPLTTGSCWSWLGRLCCRIVSPSSDPPTLSLAPSPLLIFCRAQRAESHDQAPKCHVSVDVCRHWCQHRVGRPPRRNH